MHVPMTIILYSGFNSVCVESALLCTYLIGARVQLYIGTTIETGTFRADLAIPNCCVTLLDVNIFAGVTALHIQSMDPVYIGHCIYKQVTSL